MKVFSVGRVSLVALEHTQALAVAVMLGVVATVLAVDQGDAGQFIARVPVQGLPRLHGLLIAMAVEQCVEIRNRLPLRPAHAAVAVRVNAQLLRVIGAGPDMFEFDEVVTGVVPVALGVIEAVDRIGRGWQAGNVGERAIVVAAGAGQPIQRVVAEMATAIDALIGEMTRGKRVVVDAGDVTHGVVNVFEILQRRLRLFLRRLSSQTAIGRVIDPLADDIIAGPLLNDLCGRVVLRSEQYR